MAKTLSKFVKEHNRSKTIVWTFGRFNPPTIGHMKLIEAVIETAKNLDAEYRIYISPSKDNDKNPLTVEQRMDILERLYPNVKFYNDPVMKSPFHVFETLQVKGYTNQKLVVGEDRQEEFNRKMAPLLAEGASLQVLSAGVRDEDSEVLSEAVSASQVRISAKSGDYSGLVEKTHPDASLSIYEAVRYAYGLPLDEGVYDAGIFRAVFVAGAPGSGREAILAKVTSGTKAVEISADVAAEMLMKRGGGELTDDHTVAHQAIMRGQAKKHTDDHHRAALLGRSPVIIDASGENYEQIEQLKADLEVIGYESMMIFVHAEDAVSKQRNRDSGKRGGRTIPEKQRSTKWNSTISNLSKYQELFGSKFLQVDNSIDHETAEPDAKKAHRETVAKAAETVKKFLLGKPKSSHAKEWIANALGKDTTEKPKPTKPGDEGYKPSRAGPAVPVKPRPLATKPKAVKESGYVRIKSYLREEPIHEVHEPYEEGTDELVNSYLEVTPGQPNNKSDITGLKPIKLSSLRKG